MLLNQKLGEEQPHRRAFVGAQSELVSMHAINFRLGHPVALVRDESPNTALSGKFLNRDGQRPTARHCIQAVVEHVAKRFFELDLRSKKPNALWP